jgi:hypothetical protein
MTQKLNSLWRGALLIGWCLILAREPLASDDLQRQLPEGIGYASEAVLASNGDLVAAAWVEPGAEGAAIQARFGADRLGGDLIEIGTQGLYPGDPVAAVDPTGLLHLVWVGSTEAANALMYSAVSPEGDIVTVQVTELVEEEVGLAQLNFDPVSSQARIVWQQGRGTFQTIHAAVQTEEKGLQHRTLTDPTKPSTNYYPQVFCDTDGSILAVWYEFDGAQMALAGSIWGAAEEAWFRVTPPTPENLPAHRLPLLFPDGKGGLDALYFEESPAGGYDVLIHLSANGEASPITQTSANDPGTLEQLTLASPHPDHTLCYWLRQGVNSTELELARILTQGADETMIGAESSDAENLESAEEEVSSDLQIDEGLKFTAVVHRGSLHMLMWSTNADSTLEYYQQPIK